jgi:hypothetical protein
MRSGRRRREPYHTRPCVLHAPVDVVLGEGPGRDIVQPDVVFVRTARGSIVTQTEIAGAPDLVEPQSCVRLRRRCTLTSRI